MQFGSALIAVRDLERSKQFYCELLDMEGFLKKLSAFDVEYVHPLKEHRWGQRVVRFYDPDRHIIEVGEAISAAGPPPPKQGAPHVHSAYGCLDK